MREIIFLLIFVSIAALGALTGAALKKRIWKNMEKRDGPELPEGRTALEIFEKEGLFTALRQAEYEPSGEEEAESGEGDPPDEEELLRELMKLPEEVREEILAEAGFPGAEEKAGIMGSSDPEETDG